MTLRPDRDLGLAFEATRLASEVDSRPRSEGVGADTWASVVDRLVVDEGAGITRGWLATECIGALTTSTICGR